MATAEGMPSPIAVAAGPREPNAAISGIVTMRRVRTAPIIEPNTAIVAIKIHKVAHRLTDTPIVMIEEQNGVQAAAPTVTTGKTRGCVRIGANAIMHEASPKTASKIVGSHPNGPSGIGG